jgi:hypothetical protein
MKGSPNIFYVAANRKMLDDLFPDRKKGSGRDVKYTDDDIRREASKYNSQNEFNKKSPNFYQLSMIRGLLDNLFPDRKKNKSYTDDDIRQEASKYTSDRDFKENNFNVWRTAYNRKMLDDLFPDRKKGSGGDIKYTDDDVRREASKYKSQTEFMKGSPNIFYVAANRKMLDDLFPDRKKNKSYTDDDIRREASKYTSDRDFKENNFNVWRTAYYRKMLDDLFPNRIK